MANEYLQRTPTSTGNRKVWTFSFWIKNQQIPGTSGNIFYTTQNSAPYLSVGRFVGDYFQVVRNASGSVTELNTVARYRDFSSWSNICIIWDTTLSTGSERTKAYINGVLVDLTGSYASQNYEGAIGRLVKHVIGAVEVGSNISGFFNGELTDIFFIDGQALTPEVFGYYKDGEGYISAGSTQATDFRNGKWNPKKPQLIIDEINESGGFGVNGFYLPMNSSNNFGADFHCEPDTILKLKSFLPQPKAEIDGVGDYTGALRDDPFKQYLVLALPFVSGGLQNGFGDYSAAIIGSGSPKTLTNSNVSIATTASYYGSAGSFNGSNSFMTASMGSDLSFGTDDFTIEFWAYVLNNSSNAYIFDTNVNGMVIGYGVGTGSPSLNRWRYYNGNNGSWTLYTSNPEPVLNQWTHISLCRNKGRTTFYVNGVATSTELDTTNYTNVNSSTLNIGRYGSGGIIHNGYLQDLRIYKGVAKYKGGFDVPKPYTPVGIATWRAVPDTTANNFATFNALVSRPGTLSSGNLQFNSDDSVAYSGAISNFMVKSGKWYCEITQTNNGNGGQFSVGCSNIQDFRYVRGDNSPFFFGGASYEFSSGGYGIRIDGGDLGYGENDIVSLKIDLDSSPITFGISINGVAWTEYSSGVFAIEGGVENFLKEGETYGFVCAEVQSAATGVEYVGNFGQNPTFSGNTSAGTFTDDSGKGLFKYAPPTGFLSLCEDNLPTPAIKNPGEHFKTILWTGDGVAGRSITGVGFQPDLVWMKKRDATADHWLFDSIRGPLNLLESSTTDPELNRSTSLQSFDEDGFSMGADSAYNTTGANYVAWCWKAGGAAVSNTDGTITSQVSANQTAGFSIVSWTGAGSGTSTVGHGLGKQPAFIITKARDSALDNNWVALHKSAGTSVFSHYLYLNSTAAARSLVPIWPATSTIFTTTPNLNSAVRYISYCWAEIEGFSKFGSYVGNGSTDGPFVYCGFKPAWVMVKSNSTASNWLIMDNARNSTNPVDLDLYANLANIESQYARFDYISNGFKVRNTSGEMNTSGATYIFAAFAESPFQYANSK